MGWNLGACNMIYFPLLPLDGCLCFFDAFLKGAQTRVLPFTTVHSYLPVALIVKRLAVLRLYVVEMRLYFVVESSLLFGQRPLQNFHAFTATELAFILHELTPKNKPGLRYLGGMARIVKKAV
ncbi:hypothetical protein [Neisseria sp. 83E34]|uniref:hypothetical protein n=1 Tax=Neisseria sp. 83E34 TaxID=1692264 RepID=UPI0006CE7538|nr:hypothetical protein [Neisseria sp. 83E34]